MKTKTTVVTANGKVIDTDFLWKQIDEGLDMYLTMGQIDTIIMAQKIFDACQENKQDTFITSLVLARAIERLRKLNPEFTQRN